MNNLERATKTLIETKPFYAHFFLNSRIVHTSTIPTAAVCMGKTAPMYLFNTEWINGLNEKELVGLLEHETLHLLFEHLPSMTSDGINKKCANIAMDLAINQYIEHLPKEGVTVATLKEKMGISVPIGQTWETYYAILMNEKDKRNGNGTGDGNMFEMDVHGAGSDGEKLHPDQVQVSDEASRSIMKGILDNMVQDSIKHCAGRVPSSLSKVLDKFVKSTPTISWKNVLQNFIASSTSSTIIHTKKKRNRRFGIQVAGVKKKREYKLAVCIDSSGSVSDSSFTLFFNEIERIASLSAEIILIDADCTVQDVRKYKKSSGKKIQAERHGSGGTAYQPAITEAMKHSPNAIIYFGDMDSADVPTNPKVPFLWAVVGTQNPPAEFGRTLRLQEGY